MEFFGFLINTLDMKKPIGLKQPDEFKSIDSIAFNCNDVLTHRGNFSAF